MSTNQWFYLSNPSVCVNNISTNKEPIAADVLGFTSNDLGLPDSFLS
jgi:hypothetical protein